MAELDALRYRHDELRRALDIQRETVDVLHATANVILVAALGVSAFLGTNAAASSGTGGVIVGITGLAATTALLARSCASGDGTSAPRSSRTSGSITPDLVLRRC